MGRQRKKPPPERVPFPSAELGEALNAAAAHAEQTRDNGPLLRAIDGLIDLFTDITSRTRGGPLRSPIPPIEIPDPSELARSRHTNDPIEKKEPSGNPDA